MDSTFVEDSTSGVRPKTKKKASKPTSFSKNDSIRGKKGNKSIQEYRQQKSILSKSHNLSTNTFNHLRTLRNNNRMLANRLELANIHSKQLQNRLHTMETEYQDHLMTCPMNRVLQAKNSLSSFVEALRGGMPFLQDALNVYGTLSDDNTFSVSSIVPLLNIQATTSEEHVNGVVENDSGEENRQDGAENALEQIRLAHLENMGNKWEALQNMSLIQEQENEDFDATIGGRKSSMKARMTCSAGRRSELFAPRSEELAMEDISDTSDAKEAAEQAPIDDQAVATAFPVAATETTSIPLGKFRPVYDESPAPVIKPPSTLRAAEERNFCKFISLDSGTGKTTKKTSVTSVAKVPVVPKKKDNPASANTATPATTEAATSSTGETATTQPLQVPQIVIDEEEPQPKANSRPSVPDEDLTIRLPQEMDFTVVADDTIVLGGGGASCPATQQPQQTEEKSPPVDATEEEAVKPSEVFLKPPEVFKRPEPYKKNRQTFVVNPASSPGTTSTRQQSPDKEVLSPKQQRKSARSKSVSKVVEESSTSKRRLSEDFESEDDSKDEDFVPSPPAKKPKKSSSASQKKQPKEAPRFEIFSTTSCSKKSHKTVDAKKSSVEESASQQPKTVYDYLLAEESPAQPLRKKSVAFAMIVEDTEKTPAPKPVARSKKKSSNRKKAAPARSKKSTTATPARSEDNPSSSKEASNSGDLAAPEVPVAELRDITAQVANKKSLDVEQPKATDKVEGKKVSDEVETGRPSRRAGKAAISYAEPKLGSKMRRGDPGTVYLYKEEQKK